MLIKVLNEITLHMEIIFILWFFFKLEVALYLFWALFFPLYSLVPNSSIINL